MKKILVIGVLFTLMVSGCLSSKSEEYKRENQFRSGFIGCNMSDVSKLERYLDVPKSKMVHEGIEIRQFDLTRFRGNAIVFEQHTFVVNRNGIIINFSIYYRWQT